MGTKKVGHTGTLDPDVEGVLPICIGQATKISSIIMESKKVYEAEVCLGISTETEDAEGVIIEQKKVSQELSLQEVEQVIQNFIGEIEQIPPMYSAVKVKGRKLYEYAREGIEVERPARKVTIHQLELLSNELIKDNDTVKFRLRVTCSKGTYIRTLCVDIGKALDYPAHMSHLIRTESGSFSREESITIEQLENAVQDQTVLNFIKPIDDALAKYDSLTVTYQEKEKILNGQVLPFTDKMVKTDPFRIKTENGELLALYQKHPTKPLLMKPFKMFAVR
jgi:tRNA pseudouridine55 synthase